MFKNMIERSWLSTIRKPSRSIILFLILFVMANMMLATIAIKNSVDVSMQTAKEKLGGIVYLTTDTEKLQEQMQSMRSQNGNGERTNISMPTISENLAEDIGKSDYLSASTYSISVTANASSYNTVDTVQNQREREMRDQFENMRSQVNDAQDEYNSARDQFNAQGGRQMGGAMPNFSMDISDPTLSGGDTTIQGIDDFSFVSEVEAGTINLVDGETYDPETQNVVIVSQQLLDDNDLNIGDTITLKTIGDETEITLTVIGAYQSTSLDENGEGSFNNNTIYMSLANAKKFMTNEQLDNLTVTNVKYYLAKAEEKDSFLAWANENYGTELDGLKLDIDDASYQTMVGPIENVGSFANGVMWIVIIASVVIITLMVVTNVKDRRYEMGVLLSLGAKRSSILGQIFLELVIVGTAAFILSLGTGQIIATKMGETLLAQQVESAAEEPINETSASPMDGSTRNNGTTNTRRFGQPTANSNVKAIDKIDVSAGVNEYLTLFGAGYMILIIAMIIPGVNILRYQPKTILTGKE